MKLHHLSLTIIYIAVVFKVNGQSKDTILEVEALYQQYCATCHGDKMDRFAGRQWIFGSSLNEMNSTIKNGRPSIGMPGFAQVMTDKQIDEISRYILAELPHMIYKPDEAFEFGKSEFQCNDFTFRLEEVAQGFEIGWGMAFLPDGDLLLTDKTGILYRIRDNIKSKIEGVPQIWLQGQGGLLDVALHPDFNKNHTIYLSMAIKYDESGGNTCIYKARLVNNKLEGVKEIFRASPASGKGHHFGCRMVFDKHGYLFFSVGDRGDWNNAQNLNNHCGKIHRINDDGSIPSDNPFADNKNAQGSIWSYGNRNPQGLWYDPVMDVLWANEHGPKGGDELNIIKKGANYGWPLVCYCINYDGSIITPDTTKPGIEPPIYYWIPSIGPSSLTMVTSDKYKGWKGSFLNGSLSFKRIDLLVMDGKRVVSKEKIVSNIGRVRNVVQGPDGYIYFSVERPGRVYRIVPL